ncbi:unnamed protein product [Soboliphyme baturini]|uniref:Transposase n=1 Tax=Soboliphyme baturini TaxID=241478 RepID=A0A183INY4_9BILA|nr:unnamed protein product [Soboliphyme baturini]
MGNFSAEVELIRAEETVVGRYGTRERNERGDQLVTLAEAEHLNSGNTWLKQLTRWRWTWIAPDVATRNVLDFILFHKCLIT